MLSHSLSSAGRSFGSEFRVEVAQANHDALFCTQTSCAAFWYAIYVLIEHLADVFLADFAPLILVNDTFDTLKATEEDEGMAEPLILVEIYHLRILGRLLVGDGKFQVIAIVGACHCSVWALIEDVFKLCGHSYCVAPVEPQAVNWLLSADYGPRVD